MKMKSFITLMTVLLIAVLASPAMAVITDLLVADYGYDFHSPPGAIRQYNPTTGAYIGEFTPAGTALGCYRMHWGPDGNLYAKVYNASVYGEGTGWGIRKYDGTTGAVLGDIIPLQPAWEINNFGFGPDDKLWTCEGSAAATSRISRYELDGTYINDHVAVGTANLSVPVGIVWMNDGNLLVNSGKSGRIYSGVDGSYVGQFGGSWSSAGSSAEIAWGPDGNLYIAVSYNSTTNSPNRGVWMVDGEDGSDFHQVVAPGQGGGPTVAGKYAGENVGFINGNIAYGWITSGKAGEYQLDGTYVKSYGTGEMRNAIVTLGPTTYSQVPEPSTAILLICGGLCLGLLFRRAR